MVAVVTWRTKDTLVLGAKKINRYLRIFKQKIEYKLKGVDKIEDTFILYRIIGNDLYPRHKKGQSRTNLRFILENETDFPGVKKKFIVNRIVDEAEEKAIINLLKKNKQDFIRIPFSANDLLEVDYDLSFLPRKDYLYSEEFEELPTSQREQIMAAIYRMKNIYTMNNNSARNAALSDGKKLAKWVLPWDGNCYLTEKAWQDIVGAIKEKSYYKYFIVPMDRLLNNENLLKPDYIPNAIEEPQIIFRFDSEEVFNEAFCYGRRPKVELLWRLCVPGVWDDWSDAFWDQKRRPRLRGTHKFGYAGWVARLFSGSASLEAANSESSVNRGIARNRSVLDTIQDIQYRASMLLNDSNNYSLEQISSVSDIKEKLVAEANQIISKKRVYSVTHKTTTPPSGDKHDYLHPAPYWWPNPDTSDGLPYIWRDGERIPSTDFREEDGDNGPYDRTRLQLLFDDSIILSLAWVATGETKYIQQAIKLLKVFFVNEDTRMNPHMKYAQVVMGKNGNEGIGRGIIEAKDMYYYLDAVRIMESSGSLVSKDRKVFQAWLRMYLEWLTESSQGTIERRSSNNHGTFYDLQVMAIADYLGEKKDLFNTIVRSIARLDQQFTDDGTQLEELERTNSLHYCQFNIQGWLAINRISRRYGTDFMKPVDGRDSKLMKGIKKLLLEYSEGWHYQQIDDFNEIRLYPIYYELQKYEKFAVGGFEKKADQLETHFSPHFAILPYWQFTK